MIKGGPARPTSGTRLIEPRSCSGRIVGAANIYGVPSQIRSYTATPICFIGARARAVGADLEDCTNIVDGWTAGDDAASGCTRLRCQPAPAADVGDDVRAALRD